MLLLLSIHEICVETDGEMYSEIGAETYVEFMYKLIWKLMQIKAEVIAEFDTEIHALTSCMVTGRRDRGGVVGASSNIASLLV